MPAMTGAELFQHLVATGHAIPTILITAHPEDGVRQFMLNLGVGAYLHKPLDEAVLIECLRRALARDKPPRVAP
jgi:FixJ family two-component response regulator